MQNSESFSSKATFQGKLLDPYEEFGPPISKYNDTVDELFHYYNTKSPNELDKLLNCYHPKYKSNTASWPDPPSPHLNMPKVKVKDDEHLTDEFSKLAILNKPAIQIDTEKLADGLPNLNKKRMRCEHCNKRLNITNIYNCRCGRIFCSQHRYSEVHNCKFDYKTEGRKLLEQQNPLVTASKLEKF